MRFLCNPSLCEFSVKHFEIKIKLRSFMSSEHINEKGDGPYRYIVLIYMYIGLHVLLQSDEKRKRPLIISIQKAGCKC